jgi:DNA mismatch repair protein MutS
MVEMSETANILRNATSRSLVVLDEIGRGTATFDGLSLAWAIVEYLHALAGGAPRTLFATHYHELTELAVQLSGVLNLRMAVRERGESVAFLHRVEAGPADRSYGIHVARLAGVPREVVTRAEEILANLERDEYGRDGLPRRAKRTGASASPVQPTLFDAVAVDDGDRSLDSTIAGRILAELRDCDPDTLRPIDALQQLAAWRRRLHGDGSSD